MTFINITILNNDKLLMEYYKKQLSQSFYKKLFIRYCENKQ